MASAERASAAGVYSVLLGDRRYASEADLRVAEEMISRVPLVPRVARSNRAFLLRAVRAVAADQRVDQFLDIGSGIPGKNNVHDVVHSLRPGARVAYMDIDPYAVEVAQRLAVDGRVAAVQGDLRESDGILSCEVVDWARPVCVILVAVLHFLPDDEAYGALAAIRQALAPGSVLIVSHAARESFSEEAIASAQKSYRAGGAPTPIPRSRSDVERMFGNFTLVPPGVVFPPEWHPAGDEDFAETPLACGNHCGVAVKA